MCVCVCVCEKEREREREKIEPEKNYRRRRKERESNLLCSSLSVRRMELSLRLLPRPASRGVCLRVACVCMRLLHQLHGTHKTKCSTERIEARMPTQ